MVLKSNKLFFGALFLCLPSLLSANITTLQYWDPIPFFNAANLNMPPNTQFCYGIKHRLVEETSERRKYFGLNISPFVQRAIRAQQDENIYFGVHGAATITPAQQMSDFQGTPYLMGLFLGRDVNGNSIWGGPNDLDTGNVTNITATNVANTQLPLNLKNAVDALNNNPNPVTTTPPDYDNALLAGTPTSTTSPSVFSQAVLKSDETYFGAFSVPLTYQKSGFRWELNFDLHEDFGFLVRGGFCQLTQRALPELSLTANNNDKIYSGLTTVAAGSASETTSNATAQSIFNEWVTNNIDDLLDPTNGVDYDITTFTTTGIEDVQFLGFIRHAFPVYPNDPDRYPSIIVTPYVMGGCTVPVAPARDYSQLYSLPLGNNGHLSAGGVVGLTFDFIDSIEFGFEFGATAFLEKTINNVPCPNHELQRVIYPYRQDMNVTPGFNGQFSAIFNAYEFARNTSFSFRYNYVQHTRDSITLVTPSIYFYPEMLEELSTWSSQMFIAALTFELQPRILLSIAWQGALSQRNAYCSNTILGSLNFLF